MKKLNFGCGYDIREGWDNVDIWKVEGVNKAFDFEKFPYPIKDNTYDYVYSINVFEHLKDLNNIVLELHRICKNKAIIETEVPYYNYVNMFSDVTHYTFFNNVTFFVLFGILNEKVSFVPTKGKFKLIEQKIIARKGLRWMPQKMIILISHFIPNLVLNINCKVEVIK